MNIRVGLKLCLWADNCGGQNKNRIVLWFLCWWVLQGSFQEISLKFQIKGHTRNAVDRGFGQVKQKQVKEEIWTPTDYGDVVKRSTKSGSNIPVDLSKKECEGNDIFYNWQECFESHCKQLPGIQKYHFFFFAKARPGICFARDLPTDPGEEFNLFKADTNPSEFAALIPLLLPDVGLLPERRCDMHRSYRHVVPASKVEEWPIYSEPTLEEQTAAKMVKSTRKDAREQAKGKRTENNIILNNDDETINSSPPDIYSTGAGSIIPENVIQIKRKRGRPSKNSNEAQKNISANEEV